MDLWQQIALGIVIVGAINWLLVGLFRWDLVATLAGRMRFGETSVLSRLIYIIVGLAGLGAITIYWNGIL